MKLFNKKITPRCEYCLHGEALSGSTDIICEKQGISSSDSSCRHFVYDATRRCPDPPAQYAPHKFSEEDFRL